MFVHTSRMAISVRPRTRMKFLKRIVGTIVWLTFVSVAITSHAMIIDPLTTIELETPVHFLAPDGSDILIEPGTYAMEPAEEWIRLMSGERRDAVLIEATRGTHDMELPQAMGLSVPGETEEEADLHHVTLLFPGGTSLDATGTYSGIRHRGAFNATFTQLKKRTRQAYRNTRSSARRAALQAKRNVEQAATKARARLRVPQPSSNTDTDWQKLSRAASTAAVNEARAWLRQAYIDEKRCRVNGPAATGSAGVLKSRYRFQGKIKAAVEQAGASTTIAVAWDDAFKESWEQWAQRTSIPALPFYPAFAMFPGPQAPPMPNVPVPLGSLVSSGASAMTPLVLAQNVLSRLGAVARHQRVKDAVNGFAADLSKRFVACMAGCMVTNVMGAGRVPTFAPPLGPPAGPVVNGKCKGGRIPTPAGF